MHVLESRSEALQATPDETCAVLLIAHAWEDLYARIVDLQALGSPELAERLTFAEWDAARSAWEAHTWWVQVPARHLESQQGRASPHGSPRTGSPTHSPSMHVTPWPHVVSGSSQRSPGAT